jgi:hypothetical protein
MHTRRLHSSIFGTTLRPHSATLAILIMLMFLILGLLIITFTAQPAQGQTYQVIYNFTGGADGAYPVAGVTMDGAATSTAPRNRADIPGATVPTGAARSLS